MTKFYCGCVVLAMEALHAKNNIYRDLKPENILLDAEGYVKICDFGFAKKVGENERTRTTCGTPEYVSPEMLANSGHGKPTDWWCVGILIYECLFATTPFAAEDYSETYEMINRYAAGRALQRPGDRNSRHQGEHCGKERHDPGHSGCQESQGTALG